MGLKTETLINKTLQLVYSSTREMPAHFTSNGEREQSFCINFEPLDADSDCNMASEAWNSLGNYVPEKSKLSIKQYGLITKYGEDIMVGSFIITKLGGEEFINKLKKVVIEKAIEYFGPKTEGLKDLLSSNLAVTYFNHCAEFGSSTAKV